MAVGQLAHAVTDTLLSGASPLPHFHLCPLEDRASFPHRLFSQRKLAESFHV